jgi:ADP-ribose pyrophosphatase
MPDGGEANPPTGDAPATGGTGSAGGPDAAAAGGYDLPDPAWPVVESAVEYDTGWYAGGYDLVEQPDGSTKRYYWAALRPAVVVTAVEDDQVVFVEQYRPTIRQSQLELPAGIVEPGESPSTAAARELREETGFDPAGVSSLGSVWAATGVLRHRRYYAFAEGLDPVAASLDDNEFLSVRALPVTEAFERARAEPTNDATLQGLQLAREADLL